MPRLQKRHTDLAHGLPAVLDREAGGLRVALRQEQAAEEGGGRRASGWRQARSKAPPCTESERLCSSDRN